MVAARARGADEAPPQGKQSSCSPPQAAQQPRPTSHTQGFTCARRQVPESQAGSYPPVDSPDCKTPPSNPPSSPPPSTVEKIPSQDPAQNGNAGNGGGQNQDPGPGEVTTPTHAPDTPRENPAPPSQEAPPAPDPSTDPAPEPEVGAPDPSAPAEGTGCAPGVTSC